MSQPDILILGAGAVGALHGAVLAGQGASVSVVMRSHAHAVAREGFDIRSPLGNHTFHPHRVLQHPSEVESKPDYLLVCLKITPDVPRVDLIRPALGPATTIVLIQNGVEIETEVAKAFPENQILSALAYVAVSRVGPRRVDHTASGRLTLGSFPHGISDEGRALGALLEAGGIPCTLTPDIQTARWQKCVWNMFNPVSVLAEGGGTHTLLDDPNWASLLRGAMEEVVGVAEAVGHPLPPKLVEKTLAGTRRLPDIRTSMAQDFLLGRPMEVDAILGNAMRAGQAHGVAVPTLEAIYERLKKSPGGVVEEGG